MEEHSEWFFFSRIISYVRPLHPFLSLILRNSNSSCRSDSETWEDTQTQEFWDAQARGGKRKRTKRKWNWTSEGWRHSPQLSRLVRPSFIFPPSPKFPSPTTTAPLSVPPHFLPPFLPASSKPFLYSAHVFCPSWWRLLQIGPFTPFGLYLSFFLGPSFVCLSPSLFNLCFILSSSF